MSIALLATLSLFVCGDVRVELDASGGFELSDDDGAMAWAQALRELRLGEDGVEDEILPSIAVGAAEATLMDAPDARAIAKLGRKQLAGHLKVEVLESQLVVIHGMESKEERLERERAGIESAENVLASQLACRPIYGTAFFLLAHRHPIAGSAHVHELAFFDKELWSTYIDYMSRAREFADFFGGPSKFGMKIHWQTLPHEQREPWVLRRATMRVAATPQLR